MLELIGRVFHTIKRILKENDKKVDVKKKYYDSGALLSETPYVNGKEHGVAKGYYGSGALRWETPHIYGERHGVEKMYSESGELLRTTEYENNRIVNKNNNIQISVK